MGCTFMYLDFFRLLQHYHRVSAWNYCPAFVFYRVVLLYCYVVLRGGAHRATKHHTGDMSKIWKPKYIKLCLCNKYVVKDLYNVYSSSKLFPQYKDVLLSNKKVTSYREPVCMLEIHCRFIVCMFILRLSTHL